MIEVKSSQKLLWLRSLKEKIEDFEFRSNFKLKSLKSDSLVVRSFYHLVIFKLPLI